MPCVTKAKAVPHHEALDLPAQQHGYANWAHASLTNLVIDPIESTESRVALWRFKGSRCLTSCGDGELRIFAVTHDGDDRDLHISDVQIL